MGRFFIFGFYCSVLSLGVSILRRMPPRQMSWNWQILLRYTGLAVFLVSLSSHICEAQSAALQFVPVIPCRVVDTRNGSGPLGGPAIQSETSRDFYLPQGNCGIPSTAVAYSLNLTTVPFGGLGYLTLFPSGGSRPLVSTLNSYDGRV
jgi:hypothetical protein